MKLSGQYFRAMVVSGLIIGVLDAVAASVFSVARGGTVAGVWRYVASGVVGASALSGGASMVAAGLLCHFTVAMGWTVLFFVAARSVRWVTDYWLLSGMGYGLLIWVAMNCVVVPMTRVTQRPVVLNSGNVIMLVIHMVVIGAPMAYMARRARMTEVG